MCDLFLLLDVTPVGVPTYTARCRPSPRILVDGLKTHTHTPSWKITPTIAEQPHHVFLGIYPIPTCTLFLFSLPCLRITQPPPTTTTTRLFSLRVLTAPDPWESWERRDGGGFTPGVSPLLSPTYYYFICVLMTMFLYREAPVHEYEQARACLFSDRSLVYPICTQILGRKRNWGDLVLERKSIAKELARLKLAILFPLKLSQGPHTILRFKGFYHQGDTLFLLCVEVHSTCEGRERERHHTAYTPRRTRTRMVDHGSHDLHTAGLEGDRDVAHIQTATVCRPLLVGSRTAVPRLKNRKTMAHRIQVKPEQVSSQCLFSRTTSPPQ